MFVDKVRITVIGGRGGDAGQKGGRQGGAAEADEIPGGHYLILILLPRRYARRVFGERLCRSALDTKALHARPPSDFIGAKLCPGRRTRSHPREVTRRQVRPAFFEPTQRTPSLAAREGNLHRLINALPIRARIAI